MKLALHLNNYTWPGGPSEIGSGLTRIAQAAEATGFAQLSVTDHLWQTSNAGEEDEPMLEAYSVLGFVAGRTETLELVALASPVSYRDPGMLAKIVTSLDVLSGGRMWLGLGAGWNEQEAVGLGVPYGSLDDRFARLGEASAIVRQMFSDSIEPFTGQYYTLGSTLNSPRPLQSDGPTLLIGGGGEAVTLRLVAEHADACNVYGGPEAGQKLERLRAHCHDVGRDYDQIIKTAIMRFDQPAGSDALLAELRRLHDLGFSVVHGTLDDVHDVSSIEAMAPVVSAAGTWA